MYACMYACMQVKVFWIIPRPPKCLNNFLLSQLFGALCVAQKPEAWMLRKASWPGQGEDVDFVHANLAVF